MDHGETCRSVRKKAKGTETAAKGKGGEMRTDCDNVVGYACGVVRQRKPRVQANGERECLSGNYQIGERVRGFEADV